MTKQVMGWVALASTLAFLGAVAWLRPEGEPPPPEAPRAGAELLLVRAPVEIGTPDPERWRPAQVGDRLAPGEMLRTGWGGRAEISLDGSRIRLFENSAFRLPLEATEGLSQMHLDAGAALFDVLRRAEGKRYEVHTPEAVAAVRGTRFGLRWDAGRVSLLVYEGAVALAGEGRPEVMVRAGFGATGLADAPFDVTLLDEDDPWSHWIEAGAELPGLEGAQWLGRDAARAVRQAISETPEPAPIDDPDLVADLEGELAVDPPAAGRAPAASKGDAGAPLQRSASDASTGSSSPEERKARSVEDAPRIPDESETRPSGSGPADADFGADVRDDFAGDDFADETAADDGFREDGFEEDSFEDDGFEDERFDDGGFRDDGGTTKKKSKKSSSY